MTVLVLVAQVAALAQQKLHDLSTPEFYSVIQGSLLVYVNEVMVTAKRGKELHCLEFVGHHCFENGILKL